MRRGFWTRIVFLAVVLAAAEARPAEADRPDLKGMVKGADAAPFEDATVFIYTAGPKEGPGVLCPSCYADCTKRSRTDGSGNFLIEDLDPSLSFRVLVVAKGHRPEFVAKVDPAAGPIEVRLKEGAKGTTPDRQVRGRMLGADGKPLEGAVVSIRGVSRGTGTRFGGNDDIDPVAVSDEQGAFVISGEKEFDGAGVMWRRADMPKGFSRGWPRAGRCTS